MKNLDTSSRNPTEWKIDTTSRERELNSKRVLKSKMLLTTPNSNSKMRLTTTTICLVIIRLANF